MASTRLHPGFRFHPTDVELIMYYLKRKVMGKKFSFDAISEINIYKYSPWDLPDKSSLKSRDREWFFFCPRERKYSSGGRMNRATENGYWKTTGKDRPVNYNEQIVGMIKTLVFHQGHPPQGQRTDWVIHEYRMQDQQLGDAGVTQDAFVLCKVFHKNGPGPRNGAQYGAPFDEEEWDNELPDHLDFPSGSHSVPCAVIHPLAIAGSSVLTSTDGPDVSSLDPLADPGQSSVQPVDEDIPALADDDILYLLSFAGDAGDIAKGDNSHEKLDNSIKENNIGAVAGLEGNDIYNGLPDLFNWQGMGDQALCNFSYIQHFPDSFLELADLDIPPNPINNLEKMPAQNNYSCGDPQLYYGGASCSSSLYPLSSAQIPFMAAAPDGIEDVSSILQVNYDGPTLNDDGTIGNEEDLGFGDRFNNMG